MTTQVKRLVSTRPTHCLTGGTGAFGLRDEFGACRGWTWENVGNLDAPIWQATGCMTTGGRLNVIGRPHSVQRPGEPV